MIMELLRDEPGHVAALLQLHEVATQTHQPDLAAEFLERALWAHELAYHPAFVAAWLRGDARLRGALPANAPFFRALHHHALALSAEGATPPRSRRRASLSRSIAMTRRVSR